MAVATSLREVALHLVHEFENRKDPLEIRVSFGGSNSLARQVEFGAPIDVLVSAGDEIVRSLARAGEIDSTSIVEIARGRLVLAAVADSPLLPHGLDALKSPQLTRLGVPSKAVPLGYYGHAWLENQGLMESLYGKIVTTENARANLSALDHGHVDLALLYETDLRLRPSLREVYQPELSDYPAIRYVAARVSRASTCLAIDRVLKAWRTDSIQQRLEAAGFDLPQALTVTDP